MVIDFMLDCKDSKDSDETSLHIKSNDIEIMIGNETNEIIEKLFESLLQRYQEGLEESLRGSNLLYNGVDILYYKLHKISLTRSGSYIDSPKWPKTKKSAINPKNNYDKCFQYAITVALNYQSIKKTFKEYQKLSHLLISITGKINKKDWNEFEKNNKTIAPYNNEKIRHVYKSKCNLKHENQEIIFLMTTDGKKWHYLAVKSLSALFCKITSNYKEPFYCLNCFHSYRTKDKLKKHKNVCKNHDYC